MIYSPSIILDQVYMAFFFRQHPSTAIIKLGRAGHFQYNPDRIRLKEESHTH